MFAFSSSQNELNNQFRRYHQLSLLIASPAASLRARQIGNLGSTIIAFDGIAFPDTSNGGSVGEF